MTNQKTQAAFAFLAISTFLACGGGSNPPTPPPTPPKTISDTLTYTSPTSGNYRLVLDPNSTKSHLVLDLVGPSTGTGHGLSVILGMSGSAASWSKVSSSDALYVQNGPFNLGSAPQMFVGKVNGSQLQVGLFQKLKSAPAVPLNQPLARIALDLTPNTPVNTTMALTASKGLALLSDGSFVDLSQPPNQVVIGSIVAN